MTRRTRSTAGLDRRLSTLETTAGEEYPTASIAHLLGASAVGRSQSNDIDPVDPDAGHYRMFGEVFYVPDWIPLARGVMFLDGEGRVMHVEGEHLPDEPEERRRRMQQITDREGTESHP